MRKGDKGKKVFGVIVILAIIVSVFGGVVSAEDVSRGLKQSVVDKAPSKDNIISDEEYGVVPAEDVSEGLKQSVADTKLFDPDVVNYLSADGSMKSDSLAFTIYATREGLVGQTTANGHVIQSHDHFVALPSTKALCSNGGHEFEVRVTYDGKSVVAPIWDVGPWNTKDDYWNPSSQREMWNDLPQGKPEAQAAYYDGYNSGKDQYGRTVTNPAGIDLADGTFWDDLGMTDNDWVTVEFLWLSNGGTTYDRQAAYNYAQKYWDEVCSDGYFWNTRTGHISLSLGTNIVGWTGYDCAHFVSCCIGSESHEQGGGLDVPSRTATYGEPSAQNLGDWLIDDGIAEQKTSINQLENGDVINYDWTGDGHWDHAALYLGSGKVAAHTTCVWNEPWQLGTTHHRLIHIKTAESIITPLSGDLNGDGTDSYGIFDSSTAGFTFNGKTVNFGTSTDLPLMGDWDHDGKDEIGLYRPDDGGQSKFYLITRDWASLSGPAGAADKTIPFGPYPDNIPIAGDWDGDGDDDIGGFYPGNNNFYLYILDLPSSSAAPYAPHPSVPFGTADDTPMIGDWDGDDDDDIGVFRPGADTNYFYLDLGLTGDPHEMGPYSLGNVGDEPLIGDWNGNGYDNLGVYRPGDNPFHPRPDLPPTPNQPPTLSSGYVTPASGDTSTTFVYYVTYTDSDGDAPTTKYVYVDGSPHTMTMVSGSYTTGATFKYPTTLSAGSHNYYFYFDDGHSHTVRLPTSGTYSGPTVSTLNPPPSYSNPSVSPGSGTPSMQFDYSVDISDPEGDSVTVTLKTYDPSDDSWEDQGNRNVVGSGTASWNDLTPFEANDKGQTAKYTFEFDDGYNSGEWGPFNGPAIETDAYFSNWDYPSTSMATEKIPVEVDISNPHGVKSAWLHYDYGDDGSEDGVTQMSLITLRSAKTEIQGGGSLGYSAVEKEDPGGVKRYIISDHTMCKDVQESSPYDPIERTSTFLLDDERAVSWLRLDDVTNTHIVKWKWYDPSGNLYYTGELEEDYYAVCWCWIYIKGYAAAEKPGEWVVKVYIDNEYKYEEEFTIYPDDARYKCEIPAPGMDYAGDEVSFYVSAYSAYDTPTDSAKQKFALGIQECDGTDTSCGIYPNCENCNEDDGCYPYGNGCEERDYYCKSNEEGCDYTPSNRHTDDWVDTGNTKWVSDPGNDCQEKEQKEQKYRDYSCSGGSCTYSVTDTKWIDTGNTREKPDSGVFRNGRWILRSCNPSGAVLYRFKFGRSTDIPVTGDWDGDGVDTIGVYRNGRWLLRNSNSAGPPDYSFKFGRSTDIPITGDWNGDGVDTIGVRRGKLWILRNSNSAGPPDYRFRFGRSTDIPVTGDWNSDGVDTIGVRRGKLWILRNSNSVGSPDYRFRFGRSTDIPVTGDWNNDGIDTIGVRRDRQWILRDSNSAGSPDCRFKFGRSTDVPVTGNWDGT